MEYKANVAELIYATWLYRDVRAIKLLAGNLLVTSTRQDEFYWSVKEDFSDRGVLISFNKNGVRSGGGMGYAAAIRF